MYGWNLFVLLVRGFVLSFFLSFLLSFDSARLSVRFYRISLNTNEREQSTGDHTIVLFNYFRRLRSFSDVAFDNRRTKNVEKTTVLSRLSLHFPAYSSI
jgi:hypothetical protein